MEEQIAVLEVFLVLCASNYFRHFFFLLNLYKTHANLQVICILWLTGFYPSQNSISEVTHSYALYVQLGHHPHGFYYILFISSRFQSTK